MSAGVAVSRRGVQMLTGVAVQRAHSDAGAHAGAQPALVDLGQHEGVAAHELVHVHGAAADALASKGTGPIGLTASEVIEEVRKLLNTPAKGRNGEL